MVMMLCCTSVYAQDSCTLSANITITEAHNTEPVSGLLIYISELRKSMQTDENGSVQLDSLCAGSYALHLHGEATRDTVLTVQIVRSGNYRLEVHHSDQLLHQVVVKSQPQASLIQDKSQVDAATLQQNSGKNLGDLLRTVNGVNTLNNGATLSKPVIHGLHSNRVLLLNNGIRQEDQQWGTEHAPDIDPAVAGVITVLKGAAGVRYGTDAIGGVILAEPAPIRNNTGWGGYLKLAAFSNNRMGSASGMVEHRFRKHPEFSFRLQGTLKQGGNYRLPGGYFAANTGIREADYSTTLNYRGIHAGAELFFSRFSNVLGIYSGSHTGSRQDLENAINSPVPLVPASFDYAIGRPRQAVVHELLKAKAYRDTRSGLWTVTYAYQRNFRQEYDVTRLQTDKAQLNLSLNTHSLNIHLDQRKLGNFSGQTGVDVIYQHNTFRDGDRVFIPSYYSYAGALYLIERYSKGTHTLEAGVRYDYRHFDMYNPEGVQLQNVRYRFDYRNPSATLAYKKQLSRQWEWSATLAKAWRAPQASELFSAGLHQGGARIETGNRNLKPEGALGLTLATAYQRTEKLQVNASLYAQSISNFIFLMPGADLLTIRGYYKTFNYVQTDALLYGADLSADYSWNSHVSTDARVSLLRARDQVRRDWLVLMPSDRVSAGMQYHFRKEGRTSDGVLGLRGEYVFRQSRIPANFDQIDYPRPPAAYFLLSAEAGCTIRIRRQPLQISASASNLLNTRYRDYMDLFRYFIDQPGTNIALRLHLPINQ